MLGNKIIDRSMKESKHGSVKGIGLLDASTTLMMLIKSSPRAWVNHLVVDCSDPSRGDVVKGYELHEGTTILKGSKPLFRVVKGCGKLYQFRIRWCH